MLEGNLGFDFISNLKSPTIIIANVLTVKSIALDHNQITASGLRLKSDKAATFINDICLREYLLQEQMKIFHICGSGFLVCWGFVCLFCTGGVNSTAN